MSRCAQFWVHLAHGLIDKSICTRSIADSSLVLFTRWVNRGIKLAQSVSTLGSYIRTCNYRWSTRASRPIDRQFDNWIAETPLERLSWIYWWEILGVVGNGDWVIVDSLVCTRWNKLSKVANFEWIIACNLSGINIPKKWAVLDRRKFCNLSSFIWIFVLSCRAYVTNFRAQLFNLCATIYSTVENFVRVNISDAFDFGLFERRNDRK